MPESARRPKSPLPLRLQPLKASSSASDDSKATPLHRDEFMSCTFQQPDE
jgi:hypothetical protein